jgi:hypothetical protein
MTIAAFVKKFTGSAGNEKGPVGVSQYRGPIELGGI